MNFEDLHEKHKERNLFGRYITLEKAHPILASYNKGMLQEIGKSVEENSIYAYSIGSGQIKILMWSQMHGNEGTTTKALFDFLNFLNSENDLASGFLRTFTFYCIPILNPDGAFHYTRVNTNGVDLNRDFQELTQPESKLLRQIYDEFQPHFCYNLHDQRTIFAVGDSSKPATVSFLAPSFNEEREINDVREKAMNVISKMNETLQAFIPGQVGRFDDGFNINCVGDTFTFLGTPTILFEAGHFPQDYQREETRKYIFMALISGCKSIYENDIVCKENDKYFNIPQNKASFYDFIYKNINICYDNKQIITNFAFQFTEIVKDGKVDFVATLVEIGDLNEKQGHFEYDAAGDSYADEFDNIPKLGQKNDFYIGKKVKVVNGLPII